MERKTSHGYGTKAAPEGIVETVFSVMGNVDMGGDVVHPGAFAKTFAERGRKVRVLDQHRTDSVMNALGRVLSLRELSRDELPADLLAEHPEAQGGAWAKIQFLLDTPEGKGAFTRIRQGAVDEWSFAYDALDVDYSNALKDGQEVTIRNLRTIKLWEISPVLWGMNPSTSTLSAKGKAPRIWAVVEKDDGWRVYRADEEGEPVGDPISRHETEAEALAMVKLLGKVKPTEGESESDFMGRCVPAMVDEGREQEQAVAMCMAMFRGKGGDGKAATRTEAGTEYPASAYLVVEDPDSPSTWHLRVRDADGKPDHRLMGAAWAALHGGYRGNVYEGPGKAEAIHKLEALYRAEEMDVPEKAGRILAARNASRLKAALEQLIEVLRDAGLYDTDDGGEAPEEAALPTAGETKAGPRHDSAPTTNAQGAIDEGRAERARLELLALLTDMEV